MFCNSEHYRIWKIIEKSMKKPDTGRFSRLLQHYSAALHNHGDAARFAYYIILRGTQEHLAIALPLLISDQEMQHSSIRHDIIPLLKTLNLALFYIPGLAVDKITYAHHYLLHGLSLPKVA